MADDLRQARDAGEAAKAEIKEELNRSADDLARAQDKLLQVTAETSRRNAECELRRDQVAQETASLQMLSNKLTARQEAIDKGESQLQTELGKALKDTTSLKRRCADLATKVDSLKLALRSEQDRARKEIEEAHSAFASKEKSITAENEALQTEGVFLLFGVLSFRFTTPSEKSYILQLITMYFHALPYLSAASEVLKDYDKILAEKTALMEVNLQAEADSSTLKDRISMLEESLVRQQNVYDEAIANIESQAKDQRQSFAEYEAKQRKKVAKLMDTIESQSASIESQTRDLEEREAAINEESDELEAQQEELAERQRELADKEAQLGEALVEGQIIAEEKRQLQEAQEQMRLVAITIKEKSKEIEHDRFLLDERIAKAEEVEEQLERWQEELNSLSESLGRREADLAAGRF